MRSVFFYISGHGFGHASREIEVINTLGAARRDLAIVIRTAAPRWLFDRTVSVPFTLIPGECDTGVVQIDSLRLDERATIERAAAFYDELPGRAEREAGHLRNHDGALVISDTPPLACAAAAVAGVPSFVLSNFTWDWIYAHYDGYLDGAPRLLPAIRDAYRCATGAWRLPMHGGFDAFDNIADVPFVARHARHSPTEVRRRLGLPTDVPLVLSSFGGIGVDGLQTAAFDCVDRYEIVFTVRDEERPLARRGVHLVEESSLYGSGLRYEDIVSAVDVVVSKPGYGIITECLANSTALVYTSRGRFAEYDVLVAEMPRFLRCRYIDQEALFAGRWRESLDAVLSLPAPAERPATNGAVTVADLAQRWI